MGRDDLDLYGSGVDRSRVLRAVLRVVAALAGGALTVLGAGFYALRCFDTCPSDASLDRVLQLLPAAVVLTGVVVVVEATTLRTRAARAGATVAAVLGALVALCGLVSLTLLRSVDRAGGIGGLVVSGVVAVVVGAVIVVAHRHGAGAAGRSGD